MPTISTAGAVGRVRIIERDVETAVVEVVADAFAIGKLQFQLIATDGVDHGAGVEAIAGLVIAVAVVQVARSPACAACRQSASAPNWSRRDTWLSGQAHHCLLYHVTDRWSRSFSHAGDITDRLVTEASDGQRRSKDLPRDRKLRAIGKQVRNVYRTCWLR